MPGDAPHIANANLPGAVVVEELEGLHDFLDRIPVQDTVCHCKGKAGIIAGQGGEAGRVGFQGEMPVGGGAISSRWRRWERTDGDKIALGDEACAIPIVLPQDGLHLCPLHVKAQRPHGHLQIQAGPKAERIALRCAPRVEHTLSSW